MDCLTLPPQPFFYSKFPPAASLPFVYVLYFFVTQSLFAHQFPAQIPHTHTLFLFTYLERFCSHPLPCWVLQWLTLRLRWKMKKLTGRIHSWAGWRLRLVRQPLVTLSLPASPMKLNASDNCLWLSTCSVHQQWPWIGRAGGMGWTHLVRQSIGISFGTDKLCRAPDILVSS